MKRNKLTELDEAQLLRGSIEATVSLPAVVCVTSAEVADGSPLVALQLARAFASSGTPTLLMDASGMEAYEREDELAALPSLDTLPTAEHDGSSRVEDFRVACLTKFAVGRLRIGEIESSLHDMRERYQVTVVNLAPATMSGTALLFSRVAQAVLLTIRLGRAASRTDQLVVERLDSVSANVIGVVPVTVDPERRRSRHALAVISDAPVAVPTTERTPVARLAGSRSAR